LFGKTAEVASQYLSKGRPVYVQGRLKLDQWDDKQTGQKRSKLGGVADRIEFVGGGGGGGGGGGQGGASRPAQGAKSGGQRQAPPAPDQEMANDGPPEDLDIQEESVPF